MKTPLPSLSFTLAALLPPKTHVHLLYDVVAVLVVSIPVLLMGAGVRSLVRFQQWRAKALMAQGDLNGWEFRLSPSGRNGANYPIIAFTAKNRQFYRCKKCVGYLGKPNLTPEQLGVLYNPDDPDDSYQNNNQVYPSIFTSVFFPLLCSAFFYPLWVFFTDHFER